MPLTKIGLSFDVAHFLASSEVIDSIRDIFFELKGSIFRSLQTSLV